MNLRRCDASLDQRLELPYEALSRNVKRAGEEMTAAVLPGNIRAVLGNREREGRRLEDSGLALKPADIRDDLIDVAGGDRIDLGHVAEFPVVGTDTIRSRQLERGIAVVVRLIDLVYERRALLRAHTLLAVARRTIRVEFRFTGLQFGGKRSSSHRRLRL